VVAATIKPITSVNTNIKTPFFKQTKSQHLVSSKEVLSNFKRRLDSLSSLDVFISINAFLKVILMKKLRFLKKVVNWFLYLVYRGCQTSL